MLPIIRTTKPTIDLFNYLFDDMFNTSSPLSNISTYTKSPPYDIIENDKEYAIEIPLAGVKKEEVSIDVENNFLTIRAERKEKKDINYYKKQSYFGMYEKSMVLPDNVNSNDIAASMNDGILKITIPKIENNPKLNKKMIEIS